MKAKKRDATDELDHCVFDDQAILKQIREYESLLARVLALVPKEGEPHEGINVQELFQKIEHIQGELMVLRSRVRFEDFCHNVLTDDETGEFIKFAPIHKRWAELIDEHKRVILWAHRNAGKTTLLSVARTVWELGRDPTLRFLVLSNTSDIAVRIVKSIANLIKNDPNVKKIFPHLAPNPEGPWTNKELRVVHKLVSMKDPSVRAAGVHGAVTSARIDRCVIDDVLDFENSSTEKERKKLTDWYKATVPGCLTRRARILCVGTAYSPHDLLHDMAKTRSFRWFRFPVIDDAGVITWPEVWSPERIEQLKEELGPAEWARQGLCKARDDDESRFRSEWIDKALARGNGLRMVNNIDDLSDEESKDIVGVYTGVDLSTGKKTRKTDKSAFFTFAQYRNGRRRLLEIASGKFTGPEIVRRVIDLHHRFGSTIAVESNASQAFILQFIGAENAAIPVLPHTTTKAKRDPILGVEGLAIELANDVWSFPNDAGKLDPELEAFINDMLFYAPRSHTGDRLMACYFSRELARRLGGDRSVPEVSVRTISAGEPENYQGGSDIEPYREGVSLQKLFDVPPDPR